MHVPMPISLTIFFYFGGFLFSILWFRFFASSLLLFGRGCLILILFVLIFGHRCQPQLIFILFNFLFLLLYWLTIFINFRLLLFFLFLDWRLSGGGCCWVSFSGIFCGLIFLYLLFALSVCNHSAVSINGLLALFLIEIILLVLFFWLLLVFLLGFGSGGLFLPQLALFTHGLHVEIDGLVSVRVGEDELLFWDDLAALLLLPPVFWGLRLLSVPLSLALFLFL